MTEIEEEIQRLKNECRALMMAVLNIPGENAAHVDRIIDCIISASALVQQIQQQSTSEDAYAWTLNLNSEG